MQYVGSDGWDQNDDRAINTLPLSDVTHRQGVANGTALANLYRIYPGYSAVKQEENETNFNYNSLQAGLRADNRHGLTTQLAYTWSHMIDIVQNDLARSPTRSIPATIADRMRGRAGAGVRSPPHLQRQLRLCVPVLPAFGNLAAREIARRMVDLRNYRNRSGNANLHLLLGP